MIGGMDILFPVRSGAAALDFCVRLVSQWWPDCVFVIDHDPTGYTRYGQLTFHDTTEVLAYRDRAACDAWEELGYDDSLRGTMVYLISDPKRLTLVTEHDPCPEIVSLTNAIGAGLPTAFLVRPKMSAGRLPREAA